jgi:hypothetical protein
MQNKAGCWIGKAETANSLNSFRANLRQFAGKPLLFIPAFFVQIRVIRGQTSPSLLILFNAKQGWMQDRQSRNSKQP